MNTQWIVIAPGFSTTMYIAAPGGYYRANTGELVKCGAVGCEMTANRDHAFRFKSHRAAAIECGKQFSARATIYEVV